MSENHFDQKSNKGSMAATLKIYFQIFLFNQKASWQETSLEVSGQLVD